MLFRNRKLVRGLACFFLLETLATLAAPSISWAAMGPGQPEFTSYESSGSPDLVNLTTGDFTYNIPAIEVPGPERSFSLPLTYRAGIKLEQEASWVGLGWSLNAGAIARSLNGYPDDANGELMKSTYNQQLTRGWTGGVPGVLELAWDVNTGHSGSASLLGLVGLGWSGGGISSGELVGFHASKDGITADPIGIISAGITIATLGTAGPLLAVAQTAAAQIGTDVASGVAASVLLGRANSTGGALGQPTVKEEKGFLHTNYWEFYNDNKSEFMYGSLNFGQMSQQVKPGADANSPSPWVYNGSTAGGRAKSPEFSAYATGNDQGRFESSPGADLYQYNAPKADYWATSNQPLSIAHDDFSVMGGNVSGNIRPYRLEVGSLAFPYQGVDQHNKFAAVPYLDDYKVPFRYENSTSNGYDYHRFTPAAATALDAAGVDGIGQSGYIDNYPGAMILKDPSLYGSAARTAPARKGLVNRAGAAPGARDRRLVQGKNIKWFTNEEIADLYATSPDGPGDGSFLEVTHPTAQDVADAPAITGYTTCPDPSDPYCQPEPIYDPNTTHHTVNNPWRVTLPGKGIGAFAVTAEDGTTYHYSLPVYHYTQFSRSRQLVADAGVEKPGVSTQTIGPRGWDALGGGYATTWLLTAITSSDYVDRGQPGTVDDADWGGWVRFDYGKFSRNYKWRQPYLGESYSEDKYNDVSFSEGYKETYYLNSVRTRTHTALFLKSVRNDARGHFQMSSPSNLGIDETQPAASLRLDEVVLLTNADLARLKTADGIRGTGDAGPAVPALSENTAGNDAQFRAAELSSQDSYQYVLDRHDVEVDGRIRAFLNQQALKRVVFNYSYRLCPSTPNSFASITSLPSADEAQSACNRTGKLTLESLSTYGPASTKLIPDFKFQYGFNPAYQKDAWDGFGMYKSGVVLTTGQAPRASHQVSTDFAVASNDGAAWSMTSITGPMGGRTRINYERDQYAKVSEFNLGTITLSNTDCSNVLTASSSGSGINLADYVKVGDVIPATGLFSYPYTCAYPINTDDRGEPLPPGQTNYENRTTECGQGLVGGVLHVQAVSGNTLTIDPQDVPAPDPACGPPADLPAEIRCSGGTPAGATVTFGLPTNKNGGDLRVAALSTLDETGREYQVRYDYTTGRPNAANSSGVISKEPTFVERQPRVFDGWFDYPGTSVLYGKTTVIRGLFRNNSAADYSQKEEYTFQTPVSAMVRPQQQTASSNLAWSDATYRDSQGVVHFVPNAKGFRQLDKYSSSIVVNLGGIGQPIAIKKFNRRGDLEASSTFEYGNAIPNPDGVAGQGAFTEGAMTNELLGGQYYRLNRSTKTYLPTVLLATATTTNGVTSRSREDRFDFYTGQVLESSFRNFLGDLYRSKVVPAYTLPVYAGMGPASEDPGHRNMLTQEAASYMYKVRPDGSKTVVSAGVQTWRGTWATYRGYDAAADAYADRADDLRPIWRLSETYMWVSPHLNPDGTYADFTDFDWGRTPLADQAKNWVKAGEFTRYDHYSKPLESRDINGQYVARKLGYDQTQRLVTAANARYQEVAYSGAEDRADHGNGIVHFGGEVRNGGQRSPDQHHTGAYSTQLQPGQNGFTYRAALGSEVRGGRKYRLSCWVYRTDAAARLAQLYAQVDGADIGVASIAAANTKQAGDWYLLNLLVDVPATGRQLTVGCRHAGSGATAPVYVDDFRFHPVEGPATAYVYDPQTAQVTYVLDNENLFTHYEYDAMGKVQRVSKEVLTPTGTSQPAERKVKEYAYNFARMTEPNWLPTGLVTWVQNASGPTNERQHEERDINSLSPMYKATQNVSDGTFPACAPVCNGLNQVWRNGQCMYRKKECQGSVFIDCSQSTQRCAYQNTYVYMYSDGTVSAPFDEIEGAPCAR